MNIAQTSRIVLVGTATALICAVTSLHSAIIRYDASLGSLPTEQGFHLVQVTLDGGWQPPIVANGALHQFPTTAHTDQFWYYTNTPLDFATGSYVLEANLHIIDSNYEPEGGGGPGYHRSGYYLGVSDASGHGFSVGISNDRITINNDYGGATSNAVVVSPFNPRDGFHNYRLVITAGVATLFVDGISRASAPLGTLVQPPGSPSEIDFGDASWNGISESELRDLTFDYGSAPPPQLTIDVSQVRLCWNSVTNRIYHLQYQSPQTSGAWTDLATNLVGTGSVLCTNDAVISGQPHRFYRVVLEP